MDIIGEWKGWFEGNENLDFFQTFSRSGGVNWIELKCQTRGGPPPRKLGLPLFFLNLYFENIFKISVRQSDVKKIKIQIFQFFITFLKYKNLREGSCQLFLMLTWKKISLKYYLKEIKDVKVTGWTSNELKFIHF